MMDQGVNQTTQLQKPKLLQERLKSEERRNFDALDTVQQGRRELANGQDVLDDTSLLAPSKISAAPLCRQFWKAGNYSGPGHKISVPDGENFAHVHPMFLHSNATSHKWAFGAVAELLDNAVDEIQNGATLVIVDRTVNPRDGSSALLIQDDGGGMDQEALRRCISFGFSDKRSEAAIGRYGNGFKTSTMRLGADVIVFSRHKGDRGFSQSVGLLSYTFLTQTGHNRIVVPMVDYEFNATTGAFETTHLYGRDHFDSNLSLLLQWSPFSTEADLLKQFDDIGSHGTKIIIYNLWLTDDGKMELDFDSDPLDIRISGDIKKVGLLRQWKSLHEEHIANRLHYSLCVYLSILYLRLPENFAILLRGQAVERHNIANDLKYYQYILYRPQSGGTVEGEVVTTIGFLKEAPNINIHGFCVYYKNRLILPFWQVVSFSNSRGRGVVGVLEANFIQPTHNKQDFERTSLFQRLEVRLKEMTREYWDYHCGLIGYQVKPKHLPSVSSTDPLRVSGQGASQTPVMLSQRVHPGLNLKRKAVDLPEIGRGNQQTALEDVFLDNWKNPDIEAVNINQNQSKDLEAANLIEEHRKLHAKCSEYEKSQQELNDKLVKLRSKLESARKEYARLLAKSQVLEQIKKERMQI